MLIRLWESSDEITFMSLFFFLQLTFQYVIYITGKSYTFYISHSISAHFWVSFFLCGKKKKRIAIIFLLLCFSFFCFRGNISFIITLDTRGLL